MKYYVKIFCLLGLIIPLVGFSQEGAQKKSAVEAIEKKYEAEGMAEAIKFYNSIKDTDDFEFILSEFYAFGANLISENNFKEATRIFEIGVEQFPESNGMLMYLATSLYRAGDLIKAQETHLKRIELVDQRPFKSFLEENEGKILTIADDVIEKHIEATGGNEKWNSINTMKVTFEVQPAGKNPLLIERYYKRPYYYRQGMKGGNRFNSTDGKNYYSYNGSEWKETKANYRMISIDNFMTAYKDMGIEYKLIGLEMLMHMPVYHIERIFSDGFKQDLYFSAETFLLLEIKSDYIENYPFMESYFSLWDYRDVEGIKIPYTHIRNVGITGPPHGLVIKDIQINVPLADSLFIPHD